MEALSRTHHSGGRGSVRQLRMSRWYRVFRFLGTDINAAHQRNFATGCWLSNFGTSNQEPVPLFRTRWARGPAAVNDGGSVRRC